MSVEAPFLRCIVTRRQTLKHGEVTHGVDMSLTPMIIFACEIKFYFLKLYKKVVMEGVFTVYSQSTALLNSFILKVYTTFSDMQITIYVA